MSSLPQEPGCYSRNPSPTIAGLNHPIYSVHYIRVLGNHDVDELLNGKLLDDFEPSHILLKGEILPHPTGSVEEAVHLVKRSSRMREANRAGPGLPRTRRSITAVPGNVYRPSESGFVPTKTGRRLPRPAHAFASPRRCVELTTGIGTRWLFC